MRESPFDPSESERVSLRAAVSDIERELSCLGREAPAAEHQSAILSLTTAWKRMVELMALGIAPELRTCPRCGGQGMRAATRCGLCWSSLDAVVADQKALQ
jgi:hypothetical protein